MFVLQVILATPGYPMVQEYDVSGKNIFCCSVDKIPNEETPVFSHTRQVLQITNYSKDIKSTTSLTNRCDAVARLIGIFNVRSSGSHQFEQTFLQYLHPDLI